MVYKINNLYTSQDYNTQLKLEFMKNRLGCNFTYEELSEDLLRVEYAELTSRETGLISDYERNII